MLELTCCGGLLRPLLRRRDARTDLAPVVVVAGGAVVVAGAVVVVAGAVVVVDEAAAVQ